MFITFELADIERQARQLKASADQVPFALSLALNDAAFATRSSLITDTWPKAVKVRNRNFLRAALRVKPASKARLEVEVFDTMGRAHLGLHARGGVKAAKGRLAIPTSRVAKGSNGVRQSQKPANLKRAVKRGDLIFQAVGRGKNSKLLLMYKLRKTARIKADVPFDRDFEISMRREMRNRFPDAIAKAMRTRR